jgi:hypothetical protein
MITRLETITGDVYQPGRDRVMEIKWTDTNDLVVRMQPVERTRGDSDCKYLHANHRVILAHQILHVDEEAREGSHACCN